MSDKSILKSHQAVLDAVRAVYERRKAGAEYPRDEVEDAGLADLQAFTNEWQPYLFVRRDRVGPRSAAMNAGVLYGTYDLVSDQIGRSDDYDRGPYFGPFAMVDPTYLDGDSLLLATNGDEHALWREFVRRVSPRLDTLGDRLGTITVQALEPYEKSGCLDAVAGVQSIVTDVLHRLFLGLVMTRAELREARLYSNRLYYSALPAALRKFVLAPSIALRVAHKRRIVRRYMDAPGFGAVRAVADEMGIPPAKAASNLMLALHLASMPATAALIGSVIGELVNRPDEAARVREEYGVVRGPATPGQPLTQAQVDCAAYVEKVVYETGRLHPPVQITNSVTRADTVEEIAGQGCPFARGSRVMATIFLAHRDPAKFPAPERWDLDRDPRDNLMWNGWESETNHRDCVGRDVAMAIVKTFVLTLFGAYEWRSTEPRAAVWSTERFTPASPRRLVLQRFERRSAI